MAPSVPPVGAVAVVINNSLGNSAGHATGMLLAAKKKKVDPDGWNTISEIRKL